MAANMDDLKAIESSASFILEALLTLDWQATALTKLVRELFEDCPSPAVQRLHRLMLSVARSVAHLIAEAVTIKANVLLKRQDRMRRKLRESPLEEPQLFQKKAIIKVKEILLSSVSLDMPLWLEKTMS